MSSQSPFSFLDAALQQAGSRFSPPPWVVEETQRRVTLLLNHILMREPEAMARLARQKHRVVLFQWRQFHLKWQLTPAGLLDLASESAVSDLTLSVTEISPMAFLQTAMAGGKPAIRIEGDVQLAGDINWLADHVRWDLEEDLARIVGDAPAHALAEVVRRAVPVVRQWVVRQPGAATS